MVRIQAVLHKAYLVLVPLLDHTLEEEAHGGNLDPDHSHIEQMVVPTWLYWFQCCLSTLLNTTVTYVKAKYIKINLHK
jgi:predicted histidine transporter YuiF (NhaC family)